MNPRLFTLLETSAPPPAPRSFRFPKWAWIVLPLLLLTVFYFIGFAITTIAIVLTTFLCVLLIQYIYPEFFRQAITYALLFVVLPIGIIILTAFHWVLPLVAFPLYLIVLFAKHPIVGFVLMFTLTTTIIIFPPSAYFAPDSPLGRAVQNQQEAFGAAWDRIRNAPAAIERGVTIQLAKASGTYYDAKVDENAKKILGVRLSNFNVGTAQADIPFWTFADIEAEILDEPVEVTYQCSVNGQPPSEYLQPEGRVLFEVSNDVQIGCFYDANTLTEGSKRFNLNLTYQFETFASIEAFFIDNDRFTALRRQNVDLQAEYGIVEKPEALFTSGPVKIGMGIGAKQPLIIHRNLEELPFVIGVTIDRATGWATQGKIMDTSPLIVIIPKEVALRSVDIALKGALVTGGKRVPGNFTLESCAILSPEFRPGCDDEVVSVYTIFPDFRFMTPADLNDFFAFPTTYNIVSSIPSTEFEAILKTSGLASHLFRAALGYDFGVTQTKTFTVRKAITPAPPPVVEA